MPLPPAPRGRVSLGPLPCFRVAQDGGPSGLTLMGPRCVSHCSTRFCVCSRVAPLRSPTAPFCKRGKRGRGHEPVPACGSHGGGSWQCPRTFLAVTAGGGARRWRPGCCSHPTEPRKARAVPHVPGEGEPALGFKPRARPLRSGSPARGGPPGTNSRVPCSPVSLVLPWVTQRLYLQSAVCVEDTEGQRAV